MARRGIALISDEMELMVSTGVKKSGMIDVKKNTVVTVIEKNGLQEAGGARRLSLGGDADMKLSSSRAILLCTSLDVAMPTDGSYVWMYFLQFYCYPFMHILTLNRDTPATHSHIVNGPLFARSLERLLRFDNFPSLRRIVVKSVCCVLFE